MLKKRIIKGLVLIIIGIAIYFGGISRCEATVTVEGDALATEWLNTYVYDAFTRVQTNGSQILQYVNYVKYENDLNDYSFFCNKLGTPPILINKLTGQATYGSPDVSAVSSRQGIDEINPQIAYAMQIGVLPKNLGGTEESWEDLQLLVWAGHRDTEQGSVSGDGLLAEGSGNPGNIDSLLPKEVVRFQKVYEQIFAKTLLQQKPVFKLENKQASLFVDQNDGTYIYGPFQLKVNCTVDDTIIQYLIMEIMQEGSEKYIDYDDEDFDKSEAYIENYLKFHQSIDQSFIDNGISDKDKKKLRYNINPANKDENAYSTIIVDKNGNPIDFPKVNNGDSDANNFFIKFYPAKEGAIINLGKANDQTSLFQLKIKYGHYLEYTEHTQNAAFYTKGVIGRLQVPAGTPVIEPNYTIRVIRDITQENDATDTGWHVQWKRIDGRSHRPIQWESFLQNLIQPTDVTLYLDTSRGNAQADYYGGTIANFLQNSTFKISSGISNSDQMAQSTYISVNQARLSNEYIYHLNDYYDNLKCVGFSNNYEYKSGGGSSIFIPFGFAGDSNVNLTTLTKAIKYNYGFPLRQSMQIADFRGIVREEQEVTYSASGTKWVREVDEPGHWEEDPDSESGKKWVATTYKSVKYTDTASKKMKIYRYRFVDWGTFTVDQIKEFANSGMINSGTASSSLTSPGTENDYTTPSASQLNSYDSSYSYGTPTATIDPNGWSIVKVYGGGSGVCKAGYAADTNDTSTRNGFAYVLQNDGWWYDTHFVEYTDRTSLGTALGQDHTFTYTDGKAIGEYDVWIPKNTDGWYPNSGAEAEAYYNTNLEMKGIRDNIQSFISFGLRGSVQGKDVYKYGDKISIETVALPQLKIAEAFGGNVWKESTGVKGIQEKDLDGRYNMDTEEGYAGVKVDLYECDIDYQPPQQNLIITDDNVHPGRYLTSTFTDADGDYRFYGKIADNTPLINPLKKYYVKFVYNGQIYAQTLYNVDSNSEYGEYKDKTSKGIDEYRDKFNKRFENIYADSNNYTYTGQRYVGCKGTETQDYTYTGRAYGLKHVIQEAINNSNFDRDLDTFEEQYNLFVKNNTHADFIDTTAEYEFRNNQPGAKIDQQILQGTGEIVSSKIDEYWERPLGQYVDFNYEGLAPSVAEYLRDCMIEASVPYTPDLLVYGRNLGMTNLKKFPEQSTFNLHDMNRIYMDHYKKWTLVHAKVKVETEPQPGDADKRYRVPPEIAKYIGNKEYALGTVVYLFEYNGEEYWRIVGPGGLADSETIKVASIDDNYNVGFTDEETLVGSTAIDIIPDPEPGEPEGPGPGPGPAPIYLEYLAWEYAEVNNVQTIEHRYEPPQEHYINLYNKEFDLRHCWSFGVYQRNFNEVQLEKDLYKATMVVNGKKEVYSYSGKIPNEDGGQYNFEVGELIKLNKPVNGGTPYTREVRKSDYLYDENVAYGDGQYSKNIKAYLTYKIKIHNASPYTIRINEIADYYDADNLEFDGILDASGRYQIAEHTQNIDGNITTSKYTYASNLSDTAGHDVNKEYIAIYDSSAYANGGNSKEAFSIANSDPDNNGEPYNLKTLYIRANDAEGIPVVTKKNGQEVVTNELIPSQSAILFVTFKVKNNTIDKGISTFTNQIKLDQITRDFAEELPTIGKNNFAEINSYASYYTPDVPSNSEGVEEEYYRPYAAGRIKYGHNQATYIKPDRTEEVIQGRDICIAGIVDVYSNPGSFTDRDVEVVYTNDGKYKELQFKDNSYRTINRAKEGFPRLNKGDEDVEVLPTVEPDMDKAPSIRIILDDDEIRKISGYVFEDNRTVNSDGSPIGNGKLDDGETKINGVTVQLVELIQDVDYDGTFTGQYIGEKVWDECEYTGLTDTKYQLKADSQNQGAQYYSGKGTKYILNSTSSLAKIYSDPSALNEPTEDGKYCFAGLPSGDFIVRFIYGDTDRTVLTNGATNNDDENAGAIKETAAVNALTGRTGMNVKSYNGQDFKSTVYQRDLASNSQVNQNAISYKMKGNNEVKGYVDTLNQDYASAYNYNNNALRTKEELYNSNIIYYTGQPINNSGNLEPSQNGIGVDPRSDIGNSYGSMWRYDRVATAGNKKLSDVNDLYGYRQRGIDYAQGYTTGVTESEKTLLNYRAEVLSSFERLTSQEYADGSTNKDAQNAMINELTENTYMVAQTGIISMNNEYEGENDNDVNSEQGNVDNSTLLHSVTKTHVNHASDVDLGLVERPRAQVKLTKNVSNVEIKLADGQTLFNANTSMKNLMYKDHSEHEINQPGNILEGVRVTLQSQTSPELIKAEIDDEIMNGATINVTYHLQVENVGEIDYIDRDFYFYGKKSGDVKPVTTKVVRVIDYVANDVSYDASKQNEDANWDIYKPSEVVNSRITENSHNNNVVEPINDSQSFADTVATTNNGNIIRITARPENGDFYDKVNRDYVTRTYAGEVETYNTIVVTKDMNDDLYPTVYTKTNSSLEGKNIDKTTLILTTSITSSGNGEDLTYNNLAEVIETANTYGRRMQFSISGNQEMANQDINDGGGNRAEQEHHAYSSSKIVQPREIDADSAQQIQILPPTGSPEYRNKLLTIITTTIATIIVLVGAIIIKKKVYDK